MPVKPRTAEDAILLPQLSVEGGWQVEDSVMHKASASMSGQVSVPDRATLRRFDQPGPRYTSYPTADRFIEAFDADAYARWLTVPGTGGARPLSLYVHIPFCNTICYYCGCNKIVTRDHSKVGEYLGFLQAEIDLIAAQLKGARPVEQLHFGGGTPTYLEIDELQRVMVMLRKAFTFAPRGELSVEIDPRTAPPEKVRALGLLGFNRLSVGVQDFDPAVQAAVNREQSFEITRASIEAARAAGFQSVNLDLIYGLPRQSTASFAVTLDRVLELQPDRIALYHYAHLPERFKPQRRIDTAALPSPQEKLAIMMDAIRRLCAAGYEYIGMDHFAKVDDDLARAQRQGRLHRNFQGYSTRPDTDLIGLGVSAISKVGPTYAQNVRTLDEYYESLRGGHLPVQRGIQLNADDLARRAVIMALMCHFEVAKEAIETSHLLKFDEYFAQELDELKPFEEAGLVECGPDWISVLPKGKLLVRALAMVFDRYLRDDRRRRPYSKIV
jgi:oxygen-independent coproporphyrinogen-3 oxidase